MMRCAAILSFIVLTDASNASAQTVPGQVGYIEAVAQSAFGNVTSQSYGGEIGITFWRQLQIFAEAGQVRNVATPSISAAAQSIAGALTQLQSAAVAYSVKQPALFFDAGLRVPIVIPDAKLIPYVLGGFGVAKVTNDVKFQLGGVDATSSLAQFVTLGSDLTGDVTKPMMTIGGGLMWPAWRPIVVDLQYRFGRIFIEGEGINVNRAGLGVGVRF